MPDEKKRELYAAYSEAGYKIKVYDYPMMQTAGKKRYLRDFDIEELLLISFYSALPRWAASPM